MSSYLARFGPVVSTVAHNRDLRRTLLAFVGFSTAEWAAWIAVLVYAFNRGGATTAGLVAVAQLLPAGLCAPFAAVLADRFGPARILALGYISQAGAFAATAVALFASAPPLVVYSLAAVVAVTVSGTRPAQAALLPAITAVPDELTAANVLTSWIESLSVLTGPAAVGVLLATGAPEIVLAFTAASAVISAAVVVPVARFRPAPGPSTDSHPLREAVAGFRLLAREPDPRSVVIVLAGQFVGLGAMDVLIVALAIGVLGLGDSGTGYLNAAFGAGGTLGLIVTVTLVGRRRLTPPLLVGTLVWLFAFSLLAVRPSTVSALLLLAAAGAGRSVVDAAGRTLLQRCTPQEVLGRVFGVLEGLSMAGLAAGSVLAPLVAATGGVEGALVATGVILPLSAVAAGRTMADIDVRATIPAAEISLLRSVPLFAPLSPPSIEAAARLLQSEVVAAGDAVFEEGQTGDRYYIVAEGKLEVRRQGARALLGRGDGFGGMALVADRPRTETVVAVTDARLYALDKRALTAALEAHPAGPREAGRMMREHLLATAGPIRSSAPATNATGAEKPEP